MLRTLLLVVGLAILTPMPARATVQERTPMVYQGTNHYVYGFQLSREMRNQFAEKRKTITWECTSNWKQYWEELEVRENKLFLTYLDIVPRGGFSAWLDPGGATNAVAPASQTKRYFGTEIPSNGLFAAWFSGEIVQPIGERLLPMSSVTSKVQIFTFEKGMLINVETRDSDYIIDKKRKQKLEKTAANINVEPNDASAP
jgi:hypothetical protein